MNHLRLRIVLRCESPVIWYYIYMTYILIYIYIWCITSRSPSLSNIPPVAAIVQLHYTEWLATSAGQRSVCMVPSRRPVAVGDARFALRIQSEGQIPAIVSTYYNTLIHVYWPPVATSYCSLSSFMMLAKNNKSSCFMVRWSSDDIVVSCIKRHRVARTQKSNLQCSAQKSLDIVTCRD